MLTSISRPHYKSLLFRNDYSFRMKYVVKDFADFLQTVRQDNNFI
jgi:hypothetical protein